MRSNRDGKALLLLRVVSLLLLSYSVFGCAKSEAESFLAKAMVYYDKGTLAWLEIEKLSENVYAAYRQVYRYDRSLLSNEDLLHLRKLAFEHESNNTFINEIIMATEGPNTFFAKDSDYVAKDSAMAQDWLRRAVEQRATLAAKEKDRTEYRRAAFALFKEAYVRDRNQFSSLELEKLGSMYLEFENNVSMKNRLYERARKKDY